MWQKYFCLVLLLTSLLLGCRESTMNVLDEQMTERYDKHHEAMRMVAGTRMLAVTLPVVLEPEDIFLEINGVYLQPFMYGKKHIGSDRMQMDGLYGFSVALDNRPMKGKLVIVKTGETTPFEIGISDGYWWCVHFAYEGEQLKVISQGHPILGYI